MTCSYALHLHVPGFLRTVTPLQLVQQGRVLTRIWRTHCQICRKQVEEGTGEGAMVGEVGGEGRVVRARVVVVVEEGGCEVEAYKSQAAEACTSWMPSLQCAESTSDDPPCRLYITCNKQGKDGNWCHPGSCASSRSPCCRVDLNEC
jgi:hypothetical protein